jgi:hypothetical protein
MILDGQCLNVSDDQNKNYLLWMLYINQPCGWTTQPAAILNLLTRHTISQVWQHALYSWKHFLWKGFISILETCMELWKIWLFSQMYVTLLITPAVNNGTNFNYLQKTITAFFAKQQTLILSFSELCPFSFSVAKQWNRNVTYSFCLRLDVNDCYYVPMSLTII